MISNLTAKVDGIARDLQSVTKAFPANDLKEPDFDGHRKAHVEMQRSTQVMENYKIEASKKVIGWITVFLLGLVSAGAISFVKEALNKI